MARDPHEHSNQSRPWQITWHGWHRVPMGLCARIYTRIGMRATTEQLHTGDKRGGSRLLQRRVSNGIEVQLLRREHEARATEAVNRHQQTATASSSAQYSRRLGSQAARQATPLCHRQRVRTSAIPGSAPNTSLELRDSLACVCHCVQPAVTPKNPRT